MFDRSKFDQAQLDKSIAMETSIGESLMTDPSVTHVSMLIRFYSGSPMSKSQMTQEDQRHLQKMLRFIGGARDLDEDQETLDAHVLATHLKIDRGEHHGVDAPDPNRRQNRFNAVASRHNPIFPWNNHNFDKAVHEVSEWKNLPGPMQQLITERWSDYRLDNRKCESVARLPSLQGTPGLEAMDAQNILSRLPEKEREQFLYDILDIKWSPCQWTGDQALNHNRSGGGLQHQDNPLGRNQRQHHTGFLANIVQHSDPGDKSVEQWASDAIRRNRPVISGPSGHSLRYLNHWAECRRLFLYKDERYDAILPTLEEARLVMMANLLPPKNHHSYHEIMGASMGISDGKQTLAYRFKNSYDDLNAGPRPGKQALARAKKALSSVSKAPMPNPWASQRPAPNLQPPRTSTELAGLLWRFGSTPENVELILRSAKSTVRLELVPLLRAQLKRNAITRKQHDLVLNEIQKLDAPSNCRSPAFFRP